MSQTLGSLSQESQNCSNCNSQSHPAYLAGIVDGEGHIGLKKQWKNRSLFLRLSIYSSSRIFLEDLSVEIGGSVCQKSTRDNDFVLELTCSNAEDLFWICDPYIRLKRRQFDLVKEFLKIKSEKGTRRKYNSYTEGEIESIEWIKSEVSRINKLANRPDPDIGSRSGVC